MRYSLPILSLVLLACTYTNAHAEETAEHSAPTTTGVFRVDGLKSPMGVAYDPEGDRYLIANCPNGGFSHAGRGFVSVVDAQGRLQRLRWVGKLNAPKGMRVHNGQLYVADLNAIRVINLATGRLVRTMTIPGAFNITDLTLDAGGEIFAVDAGRDLANGALYQISPDGAAKVVVRSDRLLRPNSIEIVAGQLFVGSAVGGNGLLRLSPDGALIDVRRYPAEQFAPTEVRSADGIAGVTRISEQVIAVTNKESGSLALLDVTPQPLPDPVGALEAEAKRRDTEPTAILMERSRNFIANLRTKGAGALRMTYPVSDPAVFVTRGLSTPRKVAFDHRRNRLLVVEIERNSLAIVPIAAGVKPEVQTALPAFDF